MELRGYTFKILLGLCCLQRKGGAFSVLVVKCWNGLLAPLVMPLSVSGPKSFLKHLCDISSASVTPDYKCFPYHQINYFLVYAGPCGQYSHKLITSDIQTNIDLIEWGESRYR